MLAVCATALAAHGLTAYCDVSYAEQRRRVTPIEQHIHSVLEMTPVMATEFLADPVLRQVRVSGRLRQRKADFDIKEASAATR